MENKDVFISYKAEEIKEATWLRDTLEQNGISCWMAPESIPGGSNYAVEIPRAIQGCKVFVLVLSKQAQASPWIAKELDRAINANKTVMPFMIENCQLEDAFNFYLTNVQRYEAYESKVAAMGKMIAEIRALVNATTDEQPIEIKNPNSETKDQPEKAPKNPKAKRKKNKKGPLMKLAILAAIVGAILFVLFGMEGALRDIIWEAFIYISPFGRQSAHYFGIEAPLIASTVCTAIWFIMGLGMFLLISDTAQERLAKTLLAFAYGFAVWYASFGVCHLVEELMNVWGIIIAIFANIVIGAILGIIFMLISESIK